MCAAFTDADMSFLEWLTGRSLFPWSLAFFLGSVQSLAKLTDRFVYKPAICEDGYITSVKLMFIGLTNFFDQSGPAVYFRHGNSLKYANVHER